MKSGSYTTTCPLIIDGEDVEAQIRFDYSRGHPGCLYRRNGDPGDPPEPDEVEVSSIIVDGNEIIDLTEAQFDRIEQACYDRIEELNAEADAAEYEHFANMQKESN